MDKANDLAARGWLHPNMAPTPERLAQIRDDVYSMSFENIAAHIQASLLANAYLVGLANPSVSYL